MRRRVRGCGPQFDTAAISKRLLWLLLLNYAAAEAGGAASGVLPRPKLRLHLNMPQASPVCVDTLPASCASLPTLPCAPSTMALREVDCSVGSGSLRELECAERRNLPRFCSSSGGMQRVEAVTHWSQRRGRSAVHGACTRLRSQSSGRLQSGPRARAPPLCLLLPQRNVLCCHQVSAECSF